MDERVRYVARLSDGEAISEIYGEFCISRKTSFKIFDHYDRCKGRGSMVWAGRRSQDPIQMKRWIALCEPPGPENRFWES
jgi:hypothetical protein